MCMNLRWVMLGPLVVLSLGALFAGMLFVNDFFGYDYEEFWKGALFTLPDNNILEEFHHVPVPG